MGCYNDPAPAYCDHSVESLVLSEQHWVQMAIWSFEGWLVSDSSSNNSLMNWLVWDELTDRNRSAPVGLAVLACWLTSQTVTVFQRVGPWLKTLSKVWRVICFATQQQLLGNEPTACLANSTLKSCMGSQSFNNSLGAKWGSPDMIMVVECKCTGGQPHMARQNMGSQNRLDQIMGCRTCRLCQAGTHCIPNGYPHKVSHWQLPCH